MTPLEHAEALAASGVPVFPCRADKRPNTPHGFKDASLDLDQVRHLWQRHPGPLIGVPTGAASGWDALDIDPRHDGDRWWIANLHRLPSTRMHRTRSGGLHALFRADPRVRNTESKIAPGVDTRGEGGYFIFWPAEGTEVTEAPLAPWPTWLLRRILKRPPPPMSRPGTFAPLNTTDAAQRIAERVLARVAQASDGQRYYVLRKSAYTLGGLVELLPFGEDEAINRLVKAAIDAGAEDEKHAERIAKWGLGHGKSKPLTLQDGR